MVAAALIHWPPPSAEFTYDDHDFVASNGSIRSLPEAWSNFGAPFPPEQSERGLYRPLTSLSYALDYKFFGLDAHAFHRTNAVLYALLVLAVLGVYRATLTSRGLALGAALLFALHPVHCGVVDSVSGRSEVLALLFAALAFAVFERSRLHAGMGQFGLSLATALLYALACLSKETGVPLLGILVLRFALLEWRRPGSILQGVRLLLPSLVVLAGYMVLRFNALGSFGPSEHTLSETSVIGRALTGGAVFAEYVRLLVAPFTLQLDFYYQRAVGIHEAPSLQAIIGLVLAVAAITTFLWGLVGHFRQARVEDDSGKSRLAALTQASIALIFLFPVSHVIGIDALMSERFLFAPSLGAIGLAVLMANRMNEGFMKSQGQRRVAIGALSVIAALFALRTMARAKEWRDGVLLWEAVVEKIQDDFRPYSNLGEIHLSRNQLEEARLNFERALELSPGEYPPQVNLAIVHERLGNKQHAASIYRRLLRSYPNNATIWGNLGVMEYALGNVERAVECLRRSLSLNPNHAQVQANLQRALASLRDHPDNEDPVKQMRVDRSEPWKSFGLTEEEWPDFKKKFQLEDK